MTSYELATIYTDLVSLHDEVPEEESVSRDAVGSLRSKYHSLMMSQFTLDGIAFSDRFEAARIAFQMVSQEEPVNDSKPAALHSLAMVVNDYLVAQLYNEHDPWTSKPVLEAWQNLVAAHDQLVDAGWKPKKRK